MPTVVHLPTGKALTVRTASDVFLDSLGNPNTVRNYGIGVGKTVERLGESRPLASVADDEIGEALELLWGTAAVNTWNSRRASVLSWLGWCCERGYDGPTVPTWAKRLTVPDSETPARSKMAIDRLIARREVNLREKTLWRMLYSLNFVIADRRIAFDPALALPPADRLARDGQLPVDGVGVHLVRPCGGSFAMNPGCLPMIAEHRPNLVHVVLDNGAHESTGGQRTVALGDPAAMALAAGYAAAYTVVDLEQLAALDLTGTPTLVRICCKPRSHPAGKRVEQTPQELVERFRAQLTDTAVHLEGAV